jgi:beta-phosphoglucomutase-like phosphatase (HAD superfamily)
MQYRCLVLDHDDTLVRTTPEIHYPSFVEAMRALRPGRPPLTLEQFIGYCFDPGFLALCKEIMEFSDQEMLLEQEIWRRHTQKVPECYEGFDALLPKYRAAGGRVCVVSHSERRNILRDYRAHFDFVPDMVFGWELPQLQRKPNPYPLDHIMEEMGLSHRQLLVVDDLKPGLDMAQSRDVDFAWAGWSDTAAVASGYMHKNARYRLHSPLELGRLLMQ